MQGRGLQPHTPSSLTFSASLWRGSFEDTRTRDDGHHVASRIRGPIWRSGTALRGPTAPRGQHSHHCHCSHFRCETGWGHPKASRRCGVKPKPSPAKSPGPQAQLGCEPQVRSKKKGQKSHDGHHRGGRRVRPPREKPSWGCGGSSFRAASPSNPGRAGPPACMSIVAAQFAHVLPQTGSWPGQGAVYLSFPICDCTPADDSPHLPEPRSCLLTCCFPPLPKLDPAVSTR